jgi:hypothetical protein
MIFEKEGLMSRIYSVAFIMSIALLSLAFVLSGTVAACSVLEKERAHLGVSEGFRGKCSNNGFPITCVSDDDEGLSCNGPGGTYSGNSLDALIFSACGCHAQEEEQEKMKKELNDY